MLRRGLRNFLRGAALSDDERYDLLLAAGEAVSNAIEHAVDPSEQLFEVVATIATPASRSSSATTASGAM